MSQKKSERWQTLRKIADQFEQQAAQSLGRSNGNLHQQQQRLEELLQYREEYNRQFQQTGARGMDGATLQSFQKFLIQLDQAIAQQRQTVAAAERDCDDKRHTWQDKHKTTRIYDKTIERFVAQEQHTESRKEQHESDDRVKRHSADD
ncbi:MAG: flagellar export protein FliJ [Gammaproteobacteria bacterium]|nr:flagellar export protein FliJ [Gammaproteobacteria bacterium]